MPDVTMPQLGETVTEGTITKWFKAVGDQVARDEPLFEVSTDKVDSEVPSPAEGVLTEILVPEGDTVDVGVTLAVIGDEAAANGRGSAAGRGRSPSPAAPAVPAGAGRAASRRPEAAAAAAAARLPASEHTGDPSPAPTPERPAGPGHRTGRATGWCSRRWCASCSTSTTSTRPTSAAPDSAGGSPGAMSRRPSPRPATPGRRRPTRRRCRASPTAARRRAADAARRSPGAPDAARRRGRPLHQHPAPHRRAHGPLQGDLGPHPDGQGDRLRAGRAGPAGPRRPLPGRGGLRPHLPARSPPGPRSRPWPSSRISTPRWATTP